MYNEITVQSINSSAEQTIKIAHHDLLSLSEASMKSLPAIVYVYICAIDELQDSTKRLFDTGQKANAASATATAAA